MTTEPKASTRTAHRSSRPVAMVSLDGGGVRGISSLLILRDLLTLVKQELVGRNVLPDDHSTLHPQDIFHLAAGTSTGGLIVLMLVKLDMAIDECLDEYQHLSKQIFRKQRPVWRRIFGSDISKFSADRLQTAVEDLLSRKGLPRDLSLRCSSQGNQMQGSVLAHETPSLAITFFCTHECHGPYHHDMMNCELELRHAARATSAAPSYFKAMPIQGRDFVDGGYGETNNPSWEAWWHYKQNHDLTKDQQLIMINIGTGTPSKATVEPQRPKRPLWTKFVPNGIVSALGLMSDLTNMATESESPAIRLNYIANGNPEQLFFERFSADTGIDKIKLDDWQAATTTIDKASLVQLKTEDYLEKPEIQTRLKRAAKALADIYVDRQSDLTIASPVDFAEPANVADTNHLISREEPSVAFPSESLPAVGGLANDSVLHDAVPSLGSISEPTQSPSTSPPRTPEPFQSNGRLTLSAIVTEQSKELLQGQGEQFVNNKNNTASFSSTPHSPTNPTRSSSRKAKRASTLPPISSNVWESDDGD